jgi:MerR family mercuric resistance operon transcriptional regulator
METGMLTIGRLARRAGVRPSTVRYYETHRIIPQAQRLPNGYRVYPGDTASWLRFIRHAQAFGMKLDDIRELLNLAIGGTMPCERVRQLAREQIKQIDRNMRELQSLRGQLQKLVRLKARHTAAAQVCPLIDAVGEVAGR